MSETDKYKVMAHRTLSKELVAQGVPQEFWTTSPVCIIRNVRDSNDSISQAIESRGTVIVFEPTWAEAYAYIGGWYWDQEIYDYLLERLPLLREPDIRLVTNACNLKTSNIPGLPWQSVIDRHAADTAHVLVTEYLKQIFSCTVPRSSGSKRGLQRSRPVMRKQQRVGRLGTGIGTRSRAWRSPLPGQTASSWSGSVHAWRYDLPIRR